MREIWLVNFNFANFKYARKLVGGGGITSRISLNDKMIKTVGVGERGFIECERNEKFRECKISSSR